jgi:trigger factor
MQSKKKNLSKNRIKLSIMVSPKEMTRFFDDEYDRLKETVEIPGFRAGKAPRIMIIEKIGHTRLSQLALQGAVDESFKKSLIEHGLYPVTAPSISILKHPSFSEDFSKNELSFEVEFDILPQAKIGNYKKIKIEKIDPKSLEVSKEEINKIVDYLRRQAAQLTDIDRKIKKGDWVEISFEGSLKGVISEKLSSQNLPIVIGETKLIPGFEDKILSLKKGDSKEFELLLPSDFYDKEFGGKKVKFKVDVIGHKEVKLPPVDKAFLERFGIKSEKELKSNIKKSLLGEKKERARRTQVAHISQQIINLTKVDIPKSLIDSEKKRIKESLSRDLASKGASLEKYLSSLNMTEDKLESDLESQARKNIILGVGVGEIAKAEKINLSSEGGTNNVFDYLIEKNSR